MATAYSDNEDGVEDITEEVTIKYYFYRGYQYKDILDLLATYHNLEISERTLHRRLAQSRKYLVELRAKTVKRI